MDDKFYYKVKSLHAEAQYLAHSVNITTGGLVGLIANDKKREEVLRLLGEVQRDIKSIQDKTTPVFRPEFPSDEGEY